MSAHRAKQWMLRSAAVYFGFWLVTALVGIRSVDRIFDQEFARGSVGFNPHSTPMQVARIPFQPVRDPSDFPTTIPDSPWRMRSHGIAVAPFIILDEAAWHTDVLAGYAGRRVVFWFFGLSTWLPLKTYWVS